ILLAFHLIIRLNSAPLTKQYLVLKTTNIINAKVWMFVTMYVWMFVTQSRKIYWTDFDEIWYTCRKILGIAHRVLFIATF
ncbi:hypothetical protein, partial [Vibrio cholerae]|uniref:hypothetical protein n=1 Tax=Vibrio cholerae TaxID=666 RepID=UPI00301CA359